MKIDIEKTLSISKVNQNFSSAARMADDAIIKVDTEG